MIVRRKGSVLEADIHGMNPAQARRELIGLLDRAGQDVTAVHVIHGYRGGNALREMVQKALGHPRIAYKCETLGNEGETKIYLKTKYSR